MKRRQENCWQAKNNLEKILIFVIAILLCFIFAIFVVLFLQYARSYQEPENTTNSTCMTPQCVQAAAQIMDFIDPSIDPCNNFYDFTCGTFLEKSIERRETNTFRTLANIATNRLDAFITEPSAESLGNPLQLQRKFYRSCLNTTAIDQDNNDALIDLIVKVGEWPLRLGRLWNEQKFHWLWTMVKCRNLGVRFDYFMRITATEATINGTEMMLLSINPPTYFHLPSNLRNHYLQLMINVSLDMEAINPQSARDESYRVLFFEDQIIAFVQDQEKNGREKLVQVADLEKEYPAIPWVDFLNNITVTSVPFTNDSWIQFGANHYLNNLLELLNHTQESIQANYVIWKLVESYANYWNEGQRTRYNSFLMSINRDSPDKSNRKAFCLSQAKEYFPSVAEIAYVRKYVQSEVRGHIKEMLKEIRNQLIIRVQQNDWLDDKSKVAAEAKLKEIQWFIVASDRVFNDSEKIVSMDEFDLKTDNVVEMTQELFKRKSDNYFRQVNRNLSDVTSEVLESSAILKTSDFYTQLFNVTVLSSPILQDIIYNLDRPQYMNYGALGSLIGRKFTHDLINQGNEKNSSEMSWPNRTREEYEAKIDCLLEEYENYTRHLEEFTDDDGTVALAENLAELVGPNVAYEAYQNWVQYHPQEENLPGLNYTPNQVFWIMFGAIRCHQPRLDDDYVYGTNYRTPAFTVDFSVKNSPDFAKDFKCSINSKMNPEKKCRIL